MKMIGDPNFRTNATLSTRAHLEGLKMIMIICLTSQIILMLGRIEFMLLSQKEDDGRMPRPRPKLLEEQHAPQTRQVQANLTRNLNLKLTWPKLKLSPTSYAKKRNLKRSRISLINYLIPMNLSALMIFLMLA